MVYADCQKLFGVPVVYLVSLVSSSCVISRHDTCHIWLCSTIEELATMYTFGHGQYTDFSIPSHQVYSVLAHERALVHYWGFGLDCRSSSLWCHHCWALQRCQSILSATCTSVPNRTASCSSLCAQSPTLDQRGSALWRRLNKRGRMGRYR